MSHCLAKEPIVVISQTQPASHGVVPLHDVATYALVTVGAIGVVSSVAWDILRFAFTGNLYPSTVHLAGTSPFSIVAWLFS